MKNVGQFIVSKDFMGMATAAVHKAIDQAEEHRLPRAFDRPSIQDKSLSVKAKANSIKKKPLAA